MGRFIFIGGVRFFGDNDIRVGKHGTVSSGIRIIIFIESHGFRISF